MTPATGGPVATRPAAAGPSGPNARTGMSTLPVLVAVTVCLLPFLVPAAPGNVVAADLGMVGCVTVALLWTSRKHHPVQWPYAAGVLLMMVGGALAATLTQATLSTAVVLVQDLLLLLWAVTLALGRLDPTIVRAAAFAWCRFAAVYATAAVCAYLIGFSPLSGVTSKDGVRASYTFGDPNLAGNYLVTSLFLIAACRVPRSDSLRRLAYLMLVSAIAFTGSNGAVLTLAIGLALVVALSQLRAHGPLAGLRALVLVALAMLAVTTLALPRVNLEAVRERASESIPLLRDSVGRSNASASERATLLGEGYDLYLSGDATGYGPARTKATLEATQAPYVKEAHNDYLATLLERGLVGCLGLLVLGWAIGRRCCCCWCSPRFPAVSRTWCRGRGCWQRSCR